MANPTTNFGWVMPTATDLVTDLPADFAVFGQGVDTTMAGLKGGTTAQVLSKTSATDMAFTWVTPQVGDITDVAVTSPITGGGSSGAVTIGIQDASTTVKGATQLTDSTSSTSTTTAATPNAVKTAYDLANGAIAKTTVTTAGDIIYRNATVPARLAIGTAGQVLQVNSGATAPEWATVASGGMTLISTTTLSGASTSVSVAANSYVQLFISISGVNLSTTASYNCRFNSDSSSQNVIYLIQWNEIATTSGQLNADSTALPMSYPSFASGSNNNSGYIQIFNPNVVTRKTGIAGVTGLGTSAQLVQGTQFSYNGTAVISNLTFNTTSGTFSGGTVQLYGVK
jgi:hypothetical protein